MKFYLAALIIVSLNMQHVFSQNKVNVREKLQAFYDSPVDFKNQEPGSIDFGFGNGMQITSKDSTARLKVSLRFQTLFLASKTMESNEKLETNFLIRRARLKFDGFAFSPNLVYKVELGLSNRDISPRSDFDEVGQGSRLILDAVLKWNFHKNFAFWVGQTKLPGNRERVISSQNLQFVDRSLVNSWFNIDRDIAIQMFSKFYVRKSYFVLAAAISNGEGRNIVQGNIGGFAYTGRIEFLPMGKFTGKGDYFGGDLFREDRPKLSLAFSYDFNHNASRSRGRLGSFVTDDSGDYILSNLTTYFADLMFKYQGLSVMAEFASRDSEVKAVGFASGTALVAQLGYIINRPKFENFEIAYRYTKVNPHSGSSLKETAEYTLGVSKYFSKHSLKLQSDISLRETVGLNQKNIIYRIQSEFAF